MPMPTPRSKYHRFHRFHPYHNPDPNPDLRMNIMFWSVGIMLVAFLALTVWAIGDMSRACDERDRWLASGTYTVYPHTETGNPDLTRAVPTNTLPELDPRTGFYHIVDVAGRDRWMNLSGYTIRTNR